MEFILPFPVFQLGMDINFFDFKGWRKLWHGEFLMPFTASIAAFGTKYFLCRKTVSSVLQSFTILMMFRILKCQHFAEKVAESGQSNCVS